MDYQNRAGNKGAGIAGASETAMDRRERLRKLALETIDISKDPYILRNHVGGIECRLCLTAHANEGSYLAHTQGRKHQTNLGQRAAKDAEKEQQTNYTHLLMAPRAEMPKKSFIKIGRPGYKITKLHEPLLNPLDAGEDEVDKRFRETTSGRVGLFFQISLPEIKEGVIPLHRFMSSFEQRQDPPNRAWQYLVVAAEPYETIAFKMQSREIDHAETLTFEGPTPQQRAEPGTWSHWDPTNKSYTIQVMFRR
ncbi:CWF complex protein sap62 [Malassezia sp. CBS 17886]|nr:CWF complex protein sap62 [Malassezia sp. CBS 17886]